MTLICRHVRKCHREEGFPGLVTDPVPAQRESFQLVQAK
ncbi:hypothetical protein AS9A_3816 [Hoyosella subflava DQS3-9A1]|uniref:Uncharacterized protein n=1 Tax=Hoyosella subflava (strain DSM 45089 / JCM 17490 / NBRC 109087 / DQS3-9A1) TaxID=443218 RepID=F6EFZ0_HOYSD|nr:hypothetical protein AS9A_3816 [Hoyosella subflava DQS3-9A1]